MKLFDIILERAEGKKKYFANPKYYAGLIKSRAKEIFNNNVRVFLFGSIVKGNYTLSSDIDVLVTVPFVEPIEKAKIITHLKQDFEFASPFHIIICNFDQYERWFKKHLLDKYVEIE